MYSVKRLVRELAERYMEMKVIKNMMIMLVFTQNRLSGWINMIETKVLTVLLKVIMCRLAQTNTGLIKIVVRESSQYSLLITASKLV